MEIEKAINDKFKHIKLHKVDGMVKVGEEIFNLYVCRTDRPGSYIELIYVLSKGNGATISNIPWTSIHFRTYDSVDSFLSVFPNIDPNEIPREKLASYNDQSYVELEASELSRYDRMIYLPTNKESFKITLLSPKTTEYFGNNLPLNTDLVSVIEEFSTIVERI